MYSVETAARTKMKSLCDVGAMQDPGDDRVEERLGELRPLVVDEQADVVQLHLLPGGVVELLGRELAAKPLDALPHALVVEADPLSYRPLRADPVGELEALLGPRARLAKER